MQSCDAFGLPGARARGARWLRATRRASSLREDLVEGADGRVLEALPSDPLSREASLLRGQNNNLLSFLLGVSLTRLQFCCGASAKGETQRE